MNFQEPIGGLVERIARALERLAPPSPRKPEFDKVEAFIWQAEPEAFLPVANVNRVPLSLLRGIDRMRDVLYDNTVRFARGLPANNALLWGARGTGKSSLVKAVHAAVTRETKSQAGALKLVEIHREDIGSLPRCLTHLRDTKGKRFILFCDDLSFEARDTSYKSLKAMLEGGIEGRPEHVLFYATSNRRHLMPREMLENERSTAINRRRASMRPYRSQTASACGSASTIAARTTISTWCGAMPRIIACPSPTRRSRARRSPGRLPAARARAALLFNTFRIWQGAWACGLTGTERP